MTVAALLAVALINLVACSAMAGLIWVIQRVHYPLMAAAVRDDDASAFIAFEARHTRGITPVVAPLMFVELLASATLAVLVGSPLAWAGLGAAAVAWASTFLLQVPCHTKLRHGFDAAVHHRLCRSNWVRTAAWTLHAALAFALVLQMTR